jgi:hypothetical protein
MSEIYCNVLILRLNEMEWFEIYMPRNKINWYYDPTKDLHIFDEITIEYVNQNFKVIVAVDVINYLFPKVIFKLERAIKKQLKSPLPDEISNMSFYYNQYLMKEESIEDIFSQYWLFSSIKNIQTWIYNINGKICLEIGESYPDAFDIDDEKLNKKAYKKFMQGYKPMVIKIIPAEVAKKWLIQCKELLTKIEKHSAQTI